MAVISEVKCGRCDRRYSGFRGRCPYCGARRNKRGKHADDADNAKAKLIIGILLLVLLIAATMVLILTSIPKDGEVSSPTDSADVSAAEPSISTGIDVTDIEDPTEPSPSEEPSPSNSAVVQIAEVHITWKGDGQERKDITLGKVGEKTTMSYTTIPDTDTTGKIVHWESSDPTIFMVTSDGTVTAIGKGSATLTCTIDGVVGKCIIRVKGA